MMSSESSVWIPTVLWRQWPLQERESSLQNNTQYKYEFENQGCLPVQNGAYLGQEQTEKEFSMSAKKERTATPGEGETGSHTAREVSVHKCRYRSKLTGLHNHTQAVLAN